MGTRPRSISICSWRLFRLVSDAAELVAVDLVLVDLVAADLGAAVCGQMAPDPVDRVKVDSVQED